MSIIFVLVPISLLLIGAAVWALFWAVDAGQFDDLERHSRSILDDADAPPEGPAADRGSSSPGSLPPRDGQS